MKIDNCLQLLEKMKNFKIKLEQIDISGDKLLDLQQETVELLLKANNKEQLLAILKKAEIVLEGAKLIIDEEKSIFHTVYASDILCNKDAIKSEIALNGAKCYKSRNSNRWSKISIGSQGGTFNEIC